MLRELSSNLQRVERLARIGGGEANQLRACVIVERKAEFAESALGIVHRAIDDSSERLLGERIQHQHARARKQGRHNFERWIFGGRANQRDEATFNMRQKSVLLRAIPAMDLIDENDCASPSGFHFAARISHRLAQDLRPRN